MAQRYEKYLTFPIVIMKESLTEIKSCLYDAMSFCLYDNCQRSGGTPEQSANFFGIVFGNQKQSLARGKILYNSIPGKSPKTSIDKEMIFDFYKNDKTEFELVTFLAFAASRSIIQKQAYVKITNDYLLGRMSGHSGKGSDLCPALKKYTTRYQLDKIKTELQTNWGLKLYGYHSRGFYVSFSMELKDLVYQVEKRRNSRKKKLLTQQKKAARDEAVNKLNLSGVSEGLIRPLYTQQKAVSN